MTERPENSEDASENLKRLSDRRQLLKLGAAGLPMVLTLKASAQQVVISQLQCAFVLPKRVRILVDCDGRAWVGSRRVRYTNGKGWLVSDLDKFKDRANYVFPANTVPSDYRPSECPAEVCDPDDDDDDDNSYNSSNQISELDALLNAPMPSNASEIAGFTQNSSRSDDDDDDCDPKYQDNGYELYTIDKKSEITPADYLNGSNWDPSSDAKGLYIALSLTYANSYGNQGSWPGISCIVSILNYLG